MTGSKFTGAAGTYIAADRRQGATAGADPTTQAQAEKTKRGAPDDIAAYRHPNGLHLLAADKAYAAGTASRWGSPIAERLAADINRETRLRALGSPSTSTLNASN